MYVANHEFIWGIGEKGKLRLNYALNGYEKLRACRIWAEMNGYFELFHSSPAVTFISQHFQYICVVSPCMLKIVSHVSDGLYSWRRVCDAD
jgi:hypothetical protein